MIETPNLRATARRRNTPLIIGVSGHRDLHPDCIGPVTAWVTDFLDQVISVVPDTELRVAVGMAEGADLLVAQAALDKNLAVDAVLPMPMAQYAADFNADTWGLLQRLLQHPKVRVIELPLPAESRNSSSAAPSGSTRDSLYANLSDYLMRKSSLLLALWDGVPSPLVGGTADTMLRYLSARTNEVDSGDVEFVRERADSTSATQFVYWIPVQRSDALQGNRFEQPCYLSGIGENLLQRHDLMPPELRHQLFELNHYNRAFEHLWAQDHPDLGTLMDAVPNDTAPDDRRSLEQIDAEYGKADALAVFYQKRSDRLFHFSSYMAAVIALLFLIYAELVSSSLLLFAYLAVLLLGIGLFYSVAGQHWFSRHLVCRVLAETMRIKFFLRVASADRMVNPNELIDLTGINQFSGFTWISNVLRFVDDPDYAAQSVGHVSPHHLERVHQVWIVGQHDYFKYKVERLERTYHRLEKMKQLLIYLMIIVALVLVVFAHSLERVSEAIQVPIEHWLIFLMGLLPIWLGIWELYQYKMATRELLWQYRNQLSHFSRARLQLSRTKAWSQKVHILANLGKESLMESYLWMIHRYHREHEPPAAG